MKLLGRVSGWWIIETLIDVTWIVQKRKVHDIDDRGDLTELITVLQDLLSCEIL